MNRIMEYRRQKIADIVSACDPKQLGELLDYFQEWAKENFTCLYCDGLGSTWDHESPTTDVCLHCDGEGYRVLSTAKEIKA